MAFKYNPADATTTWPDGDYEATLVKVDDEPSKNTGAEMLTLTFKVYNGSKEITLKDYIVAPSTVFKLKKLAVALGEGVAFGLGKFDPCDHLNANLLLTLATEESDDYGDKNKIKAYKPLSRTPAAVAAKPVGAMPLGDTITDKDIPFAPWPVDGMRP